jgi:hypothetical protein
LATLLLGLKFPKSKGDEYALSECALCVWNLIIAAQEYSIGSSLPVITLQRGDIGSSTNGQKINSLQVTVRPPGASRNMSNHPVLQATKFTAPGDPSRRLQFPLCVGPGSAIVRKLSSVCDQVCCADIDLTYPFISSCTLWSLSL